ncbi:protein kinase domain-containing protein [Lentzea chajnantorensis]
MTEPVRRPSTPTVQQGATRKSAPTVQQGARRESVPTRQQGSNPTVQQGEAPPPAADDGGPVFPDQLRDRFEPLRVLGTGTEGVVWCCRRTAEGDEVAVKVHWAGHPIDVDLLRHLDDERFHRHVPRLFGHDSFIGPHGRVGWVAMELLEATLDQVVARRPASVRKAEEVLRELAGGLNFWQQVVGRNPIDFKPDNLMYRANGEFVIADFGGVTGLTASKQIGGTIMAAVAYTPPEQHWEEKGWPWPWWSLGEIAYLLVTGHGRFQRRTGEMLSDQAIRRMRTLDELDLTEITDERWRLLVSGLLTKDPRDRWGWPQVESWLGGGSPPVAAHAPAQAAQPEHSPITFVNGRSFTDPAELAVAMLDDPHAAERWLTGTGADALSTWIRKEKLHNRFDTMRLTGLHGSSARLHSAVLAFGQAFAPDVTPRYRGRPVDTDGLVAALAQPDGFEFAGEVVQGDLLGTAAGYRCGHGGCGPRCGVLDQAAAELPVLVQNAEQLVHSTGSGGLTAGERQRLHGMALLLVLNRRQAARALQPPVRLRLADVPWWRPLAKQLANADTREGRVLLLAQGVLQERVVRERRPKRAPVSLRAVGTTAGTIVLLTLAMTGVAWVVVVLQNGAVAFEGGPDGARAAVTLAAAAQLGLLPPFALLATELVLLVRTKGAVAGGVLLAVVLAFFASDLPLFTAVTSPDLVADLVFSLAGKWADGLVVGLVVTALASLGLCLWARSWLPQTAQRSTRRALPPTPLRRVAVFGLAWAALGLVYWAATVLRLTVHSEDLFVTAPEFGLRAAALLSGYLLLLGVVAAIAAMWRANTFGVVTIGMLAVLVAAGFAQVVPQTKALWLPFLQDPLLWAAGLWGAAAFWAALLVHVPLAVVCLRTMRRLVDA